MTVEEMPMVIFQNQREKNNNWELLSRKPNIESIAGPISVHGTYSIASF